MSGYSCCFVGFVVVLKNINIHVAKQLHDFMSKRRTEVSSDMVNSFSCLVVLDENEIEPFLPPTAEMNP